MLNKKVKIVLSIILSIFMILSVFLIVACDENDIDYNGENGNLHSRYFGYWSITQNGIDEFIDSYIEYAKWRIQRNAPTRAKDSYLLSDIIYLDLMSRPFGFPISTIQAEAIEEVWENFHEWLIGNWHVRFS
ncbi:MAG: hypothetical protein FWE22_03905 [Firmicutes bacterium]|nr:hypothetical protein [Bacillota bacterium]